MLAIIAQYEQHTPENTEAPSDREIESRSEE
jgi:hypothetical protein